MDNVLLETANNNRKIGIGDIVKNKNGQLMCLKDFKGYKNVTVEFDDGTILENQNYKSFIRGKIANPNFQKNTEKLAVDLAGLKEKRVGETNINKDGDKMTIINYRNAHDIDIQFEDGTIAYNREYRNFKNGHLTKPIVVKTPEVIEETITEPETETPKKVKAKDKVGEKVRALNGQMMTFIAYHSYKDIDIQFEDGTIVHHKGYKDFQNGEIKNPNFKKGQKAKTIVKMANNRLEENRQKKLGESKLNNQGYNMTISVYNNTDDITVTFDDGSIVEHRTYSDFKKGSIRHPLHKEVNGKKHQTGKEAGMINFSKEKLKELRKKRKGESIVANNGQIMTIIKYYHADKIDVQFEDGTIVKDRCYDAFKKGSIKNPNKPTAYKTAGTSNKAIVKLNTKKTLSPKTKPIVEVKEETEIASMPVQAEEIKTVSEPTVKINVFHFGENGLSADGQKIVIIGDNGSEDIKVLFEDGTVLDNQTYEDFSNKRIENPSVMKNRIGKSGLNLKDEKMVILEYNNRNDIKVIFEDGIIVEHQTYDDFLNGNIYKPTYTLNTEVDSWLWRIAEKYMNEHNLSERQFIEFAISEFFSLPNNPLGRH